MPISFEKIGQYLHYLSEVHGVQFCIKDFCLWHVPRRTW